MRPHDRSMEFEQLRLVAWREIRERVRSRIFRIGLALTALLALVAIVAPQLFARNHDERPASHRVGVSQNAVHGMHDALARHTAEVIPAYSLVTLDDTVGREQVKAGSLDVFVASDHALYVRDSLQDHVGRPSALTSAIMPVVHHVLIYNAAGMNDTQQTALRDATQTIDVPKIVGMNAAPIRDTAGARGASEGAILLFVFLTLYGAFILNGVIEEKSSRVVEIVLSTIRVDTLLTGRILGIGVVGAVQGLVIAGTALVSRAVTNPGTSAVLSPRVLGFTLLWFALGFAMYSWLYACAGALAGRSEDAQNLVFPLQIPLLLSYGVSMVAANGGGVDRVLVPMSFFPFTAPMTMLTRMCAGTAALWEIALSIGLCCITAYLTRKLALVVFAGGILRAGRRVGWREALRNPLS